MRFSASAALFSALTLGACMGPQGNPDNRPYANEPGGTLAVKPMNVGRVAYDPYAEPKPFADMQAGQAAINPPPPITPLSQVPAYPAPARRPR